MVSDRERVTEAPQRKHLYRVLPALVAQFVISRRWHIPHSGRLLVISYVLKAYEHPQSSVIPTSYKLKLTHILTARLVFE